MIELLAIKTFAGRALAFLAKVPREVWYILAALLFLLWFAENRYDAGRDAVLAKLEKAEAEAKQKADEAATVADGEAQERSEGFRKEQETLEKAIDDAQANDGNALDGLFGSLSEAD